jgi:predicted negative regulator of RcsB-dependent stress response
LYALVKSEVDDGDTAEAETRFAELRSEFPQHAYTHQAALLLASGEIVTAPDAAAEKLRFTMDNSDDPELAMVARLRLARVLAYRDRQQEALALLNVPEPGQFAGRIAEIKGDIHVALGETDAARTAYLEAMVAPGAELLDRGFLQMKLSDLPGSAAPTAPSEPPATAAPDGSADPAAAPAEGAPAQTAPAKPAEGA